MKYVSFAMWCQLMSAKESRSICTFITSEVFDFCGCIMHTEEHPFDFYLQYLNDISVLKHLFCFGLCLNCLAFHLFSDAIWYLWVLTVLLG
jgi:hypothetical protein